MWVTAYSAWPQKNPSNSSEIPVRHFHFPSVSFDSGHWISNTVTTVETQHLQQHKHTGHTPDSLGSPDEWRTDCDGSSQDRKKSKSSARAVPNVTFTSENEISRPFLLYSSFISLYGLNTEQNTQILNSYCWKLHLGLYYGLSEFSCALLHWKTDHLLRNTWSVSSIITNLQAEYCFSVGNLSNISLTKLNCFWLENNRTNKLY